MHINEEDEIAYSKFQKTRLRTVGEEAFGVTPLKMSFFVHSSATRARRWLKLQSNEFEARWVLTAKFHPNQSTDDRQTDRHAK